MLTVEQVKKRLQWGKALYGRLVTSPDGSEWIRVQLTRPVLAYYQARLHCYGFIPD